MHVILLAALLGGPAVPPADVVVVCPEEFRQALDPWVRHRTAQGHQLSFAPNTSDAGKIRQHIRSIAKDGRLRFVVLVGDAPATSSARNVAKQSAANANTLPTFSVPATINVHWGGKPEFASDDPFADLDGDKLPDVAIGRLTVDTPAELATVVDKILQYERSDNLGPWLRHIDFVAGVGGFGAVADAALEATAKSLIASGVPVPYETSMTYASWHSPYCPNPRRFHDVLVQRLNAGGLFWVYIGHGYTTRLDRVRVPGGRHHIFDVHDVAELRCEQNLPIAIFMACHTGAFDAAEDCLAEEMLRSRGAPVAVMASSSVTMPYGLAVMGCELLESCFQHRSPTLGEAILRTKRRMAENPKDSRFRGAIDLLAMTLSPNKTELAAERLEHIQLFNLIGDPLLQLPQPGEARLSAPATAHANEPLEFTLASDVDGTATLELVLRRDRIRFRPSPRQAYPIDPRELAAFDEVYRQANDRRYAVSHQKIVAGRLTGTIQVPADAEGACYLRVFVDGQKGCAMGSTSVEIVAPSAATTAAVTSPEADNPRVARTASPPAGN